MHGFAQIQICTLDFVALVRRVRPTKDGRAAIFGFARLVAARTRARKHATARLVVGQAAMV